MKSRRLSNLSRQVAALVKTRSLADWKLIGVVGVLLLISLLAVTAVTPHKAPSQAFFYQPDQPVSVPYMRAEVIDVMDDGAARLKLLDSQRRGDEVVGQGFAGEGASAVNRGEVVLVSYGTNSESESVFSYAGKFRIPGLILLAIVLMALVTLIGGRRGVLSVVGLIVSLMILGWMVIPLILHGYAPFWTILGGSYIIAVVSILISHGARRRTYISIGCICLVLTIVAALILLVMRLMALSGVTEESTMFLLADMKSLDIRGVVAGGMIIATLGVLDDVVTTQVATVEELHGASSKQSKRRLFLAASSVGTEHIASIINTLALAYAGASLPFILLLARQSNSPILTLNSEYIAVEIVRTLVASIGLIIAIPISTLVATLLYKRRAQQSK